MLRAPPSFFFILLLENILLERTAHSFSVCEVANFSEHQTREKFIDVQQFYNVLVDEAMKNMLMVNI